MSDAKQQGAAVMRVSAFDRSNWAKMASAAKGVGLESVAKKFGAAACLPVGQEIPLSVFDQLQAEWRDWLVSGQFRHGVTVHPVARAVRDESMPQKDLITELREALSYLLDQADLGEVDEETQPMVDRAKAALKRAATEESELLAALQMALGCLKCHAVDCHRDGLTNAAASADRAVNAAVKAIANAKGI